MGLGFGEGLEVVEGPRRENARGWGDGGAGPGGEGDGGVDVGVVERRPEVVVADRHCVAGGY